MYLLWPNSDFIEVDCWNLGSILFMRIHHKFAYNFSIYSYFVSHVFMCMYISSFVSTYVFVYMVTRSWHMCPHSLPDSFRQSFSLNREFSSWLEQLLRKHQGPSSLCLSSLGIFHAPPLFLAQALGIHHRPHAYMILSEPVPTNTAGVPSLVFSLSIPL